MKRIIITLLAFMMMMTLSACRNHDESGSDKATEATSAEPTEEGKEVEYL